MPLPDERPRQSVANLIGRFEQQTKRQSIVPSVPPRTSSVTSHHTGDSAKEELKEKREWPPKPKLPIPVATELPPDVEVKPISPEAEAPPTSLVPETVIGEAAVELSTQALSDPAPAIQQESAVPVPKPAPQRQSSLGAAAPSRPPATPSKGSSTAKSTSAAATKTPARTPAKAPPTSFHSTPAPRSMASAAPAKTAPSPAKPRPSSRPSSRTSQRPSTATTPARAKTPSRARSPAGPMRAMSPAITPARAKSPAVSGQPRPSLFAPTAASLAKARSAPDSVPTPRRVSLKHGPRRSRRRRGVRRRQLEARSLPAALHSSRALGWWVRS
ncbi:hypothetical protein OBBRIDRAFT_287808 [Obba rivulosa]|uniref:Uncharacterized protein n=1 Tax=Obba rivulosa TaxID=1052685 RepID=A0A8E2AUQ9_9APHY|nr:hypothetical protein OBBRIDRAFT_287808 [Obba rivulosa]